MTSSVSPYLQRPVRKLEDVKPETTQAPSRARTVADDSANVGTPSGAPLHPASETPPND